jgi:probable O-glycosylation ligase (exosortase A-associated)
MCDRIFGGGFDMGPTVFQRYAPDPDVRDHSIYFEMLGEQGFVGLAMFLGLLIMTWLKCSAVIRVARRNADLGWARDLAAMVQVSVIGYMSAGAFLGLAYFDYAYHLVAVAVVVHHLVHQAGSVTEPTAVTAQGTPSTVR